MSINTNPHIHPAYTHYINTSYDFTENSHLRLPGKQKRAESIDSDGSANPDPKHHPYARKMTALVEKHLQTTSSRPPSSSLLHPITDLTKEYKRQIQSINLPTSPIQIWSSYYNSTRSASDQETAMQLEKMFTITHENKMQVEILLQLQQLYIQLEQHEKLGEIHRHLLAVDVENFIVNMNKSIDITKNETAKLHFQTDLRTKMFAQLQHFDALKIAGDKEERLLWDALQILSTWLIEWMNNIKMQFLHRLHLIYIYIELGQMTIAKELINNIDLFRLKYQAIEEVLQNPCSPASVNQIPELAWLLPRIYLTRGSFPFFSSVRKTENQAELSIASYYNQITSPYTDMFKPQRTDVNLTPSDLPKPDQQNIIESNSSKNNILLLTNEIELNFNEEQKYSFLHELFHTYLSQNMMLQAIAIADRLVKMDMPQFKEITSICIRLIQEKFTKDTFHFYYHTRCKTTSKWLAWIEATRTQGNSSTAFDDLLQALSEWPQEDIGQFGLQLLHKMYIACIYVKIDKPHLVQNIAHALNFSPPQRQQIKELMTNQESSTLAQLLPEFLSLIKECPALVQIFSEANP